MNWFWTLYYRLLAKSDAKPQTEVGKRIDEHVTETLGPVVK